jgi:hypothetical protein
LIVDLGDRVNDLDHGTDLILMKEVAENEGSLEWLKADLSFNSKPCIIFSHVPQYVGDLKGNYWLENNPWAASLPYSESVLYFIQKDLTVKMTVGCHVHWPRVSNLHAVHHIRLPSAIEGFFQMENHVMRGPK